MNFQTNISLEAFNTFHLQEIATTFCTIKTIDDAIAIFKKATDENKELHIIGGGSNLLLTKTLEGITCLNKMKGITLTSENEHDVFVTFQSGENWHECVLWCVNNNYGGIENLSLIPGTIGASPIQNIGAYGVELKDVFHACEALHLKTLNLKTFNLADCHFGYRDSVFKGEEKGNYFITSVTLKLAKKPKLQLDYGTIREELSHMNCTNPNIQDVSNAVINIRKSKLPNPDEIGNSGSFFKNPVIDETHFKQLQSTYPLMPFYVVENGIKIPAAWLIESQGWKGYKEQDYGVHNKQALVLVNHGHAKGIDIFNLSTRIITSVQQAFNITLEREVNVW